MTTPLKLEDLDREELLFFIRRTSPFVPRARDLWNARWEVLSARATAAMQAYHAAGAEWSTACVASAAAGLTRLEWLRRHREVERLDQIMKAKGRQEARARAAEAAAYAMLCACD